MKFIDYIKESYNELVYKVTWPTWDELQTSAIIVMVTTLIISLIVALFDITSKTIVEAIYSIISGS